MRKKFCGALSFNLNVCVSNWTQLFAQANEINICTLNWFVLHVSFHINYSPVNHSSGRLKFEPRGWIGANTTNFIWVVSRGLGPCHFTDSPRRRPIRGLAIVVVTFVGGQFHVESSIQFQSDGFLFEALWKLCVKVHILQYRHPAKPRKLLPRWNYLFVRSASKKRFSSVVCRWICENIVDFNQRWRPFILWML